MSTKAPEDPTFRSFDRKQGENYAQARRDYHPLLYSIVLDYHTSTGGKFDTVLDVGCGPGRATRSLAAHFSQAIGIDPSDGMIATARSLGDSSSASEPVRFEVSTAEELGSRLSPPISEGSIDLITAATAAHWFDMSAFWPQAARMLKPGGSVALWTSGGVLVDPSMPNYQAIQAAIDKLDNSVEDYRVPGNLLTRHLYAALPLPWTLEKPVPEFDQVTFMRKEWNTGGLSDGGEVVNFTFYDNDKPVDLNTLEKVLATSSPVIRWREAHPDAVDTERDLVRIMRNEIESALREAGADPDTTMMKGSVSGALLMVKKKV
ncbi:S-adenosyl-L-methionine-dependent methyltransferase [Lasiosphaeria ovina]|uniref:S-adenosyl-L-methionine-dependent methyltransferase n=1 Tax=Lasiosphaeria ovina TaxID=92902 RepID=A0AAE0NN73_9PEZI|nr:S-adenosyl-L-methionine-dependent methyltransferase [Lasiosphaeria ovina]